MDRYKVLALNGMLLLLLSITLSLYLMYYVSPRVEIRRHFTMKINNEKKNLVIKSQHLNVKKLYYELSLKSVYPVQIILNFIDEDNKSIRMLLLKKKEGSDIINGMVSLSKAPTTIEISFIGTPGDIVNGTIIMRYSSVNMTTLTLLVFTNILLALLSIGLLIYSLQYYVVKRVGQIDTLTERIFNEVDKP